MKNINFKNFRELFRAGSVLAVAAAMLVSCGAVGGYTETDGVYYDPSRDTLPTGIMAHEGNEVGSYYDYQNHDGQNKYLNSENRGSSWQDSGSDWGTYTGTETYYNDNWGSPFGFYPGFSMSFGWGLGGYYSPWGFGYSPFYSYYSPYYGYYNPYFGYNPYYSPYYGYGGYYGGGYYYPVGPGYNSYNAPSFKRSGATGGFRNTNTVQQGNRYQNNGFRNENSNRNYSAPNRNDTRYYPRNETPRYRSVPQNNTPRQNVPQRQYTPDYNNQPRYRSNDSGFRSGSSGGFNSGSSSSGSTRSSGGFRR